MATEERTIPRNKLSKSLYLLVAAGLLEISSTIFLRLTYALKIDMPMTIDAFLHFAPELVVLLLSVASHLTALKSMNMVASKDKGLATSVVAVSATALVMSLAQITF